MTWIYLGRADVKTSTAFLCISLHLRWSAVRSSLVALPSRSQQWNGFHWKCECRLMQAVYCVPPLTLFRIEQQSEHLYSWHRCIIHNVFIQVILVFVLAPAATFSPVCMYIVHTHTDLEHMKDISCSTALMFIQGLCNTGHKRQMLTLDLKYWG